MIEVGSGGKTSLGGENECGERNSVHGLEIEGKDWLQGIWAASSVGYGAFFLNEVLVW